MNNSKNILDIKAELAKLRRDEKFLREFGTIRVNIFVTQGTVEMETDNSYFCHELIVNTDGTVSIA